MLLVVLVLALGVTARVVVAADMALGMMPSAADMPGDCGDCGDGDAGTASLCHLVCGNPAGLGLETLPIPSTDRRMRPLETARLADGRTDRPDPSPPRLIHLA